MAEKNCFDMTKLIFQIRCSTVVQWSRSCLHVQINRVRLPSTLFSVSLYRFFVLFGPFFWHYFSFWPFFPYSYCWPCWSWTWINIYFKLESRVLFWKGDFKSTWSACWPSLRPDKNHKPSRHVPPLKPRNFFNVSWHHDKQNTLSTPLTVLIYTQHPPVTHWWVLPFVHRLNHQYYYPKISTRFAPKK